MTWLVAGLGNPGDRYANTRHNLGRMVADELARVHGARFKKVRFLPVEVAEIREAGELVVLASSTRFMNESGPSYASLAKKRDVEAGHMIAVYDELDIPAGELRVKLGGGSSHNGVKSLQQAMGGREFLHARDPFHQSGKGRIGQFHRAAILRQIGRCDTERFAQFFPDRAPVPLGVAQTAVDQK